MVVVSGPRGGRERQVYPVGRFTPSMLRTLLVHGPRLAIGGSLQSPVRVFCHKEYREAHLPNFPFMVVDMRRVRSFRSTPPRARRPPERYADSFVRNVPGGDRGKSREPWRSTEEQSGGGTSVGEKGGGPRGGSLRKWPPAWRRMARFRSWVCVPPEGGGQIRAPPWELIIRHTHDAGS